MLISFPLLHLKVNDCFHCPAAQDVTFPTAPLALLHSRHRPLPSTGFEATISIDIGSGCRGMSPDS